MSRSFNRAHLLFALVLFILPAFAQAQDTNQALSEVQEAVEKTVGDDTFLTPLSHMYDGLPEEFKGYRNTPVLLHPGSEEKVETGEIRSNRWYPELSMTRLGKLDLSVDDEVSKSGVTAFTPKRTMQVSFARSEQARDDYLQLFSTVRGIAILTLSYLDKTVAAGLATTQQQVDQDTTHQLLRQISLSTRKIAHAEQWRLYDDADEKFALCMADPPVPATRATFNLNECNTKCPAALKTSSRYHYCVCCVDNVDIPNLGTNAKIGSAVSPYWSLAERMFMGLKQPKPKTNVLQTAALHVEDFVMTFRSVYGDIIYYRDAAKQNHITHVPPALSVQDWIMIFRDKEQWIKDNPSKKDIIDKRYVTLNPFADAPAIGVKFGTFDGEKFVGICPSLYKLVGGVRPRSTTRGVSEREEFDRIWQQASMGGEVTSKDLGSVQSMDETRRKRWVEAFCDAAAVTAFKRLHLRMSSMALDHMTFNRVATGQDKEEMTRLIARVSSLLGLGSDDKRSEGDALLAGANSVGDRVKQAAANSGVQSMQSSLQDQAAKGSVVSFGSK